MTSLGRSACVTSAALSSFALAVALFVLALPASTWAAVTIGDSATSETAVTVGPGDATPRVADAFTVRRSGASDTVTGLTVTLGGTSVTAAMIGTVQIASAATGGTVHGSVASPGSLTVPITLGTTIAAGAGAVTYYVRILPASHAAFAAIASGDYTVSAAVTAATTANGGTNGYSDVAGAVVTIDNSAPGAVTGLGATPGDGQVALAWTNPGADFAGVVVLRRAGQAAADVPAEGTAYTAPGTLGGSRASSMSGARARTRT